MDNQSTSSRNESQFQDTSSRNDSQEQETPENMVRLYESVNSCCLVQSLFLHGMFISAAVLQLQNETEDSYRYTVPIILSLLLMALQFFSSLLLAWCLFKIHPFFGGTIATFVYIMQSALFFWGVLLFSGKAFVASISTWALNNPFVFLWYIWGSQIALLVCFHSQMVNCQFFIESPLFHWIYDIFIYWKIKIVIPSNHNMVNNNCNIL
ncbi:MAG: hypothetical protein MHMPM18_004612, partial [Marteilia pararefringens]